MVKGKAILCSPAHVPSTVPLRALGESICEGLILLERTAPGTLMPICVWLKPSHLCFHGAYFLHFTNEEDDEERV